MSCLFSPSDVTVVDTGRGALLGRTFAVFEKYCTFASLYGATSVL
jgi:hypothetical protein